MPVPPALLDLIRQFEENQEEYLADSYNEDSARAQFIEPFFDLLDWDVSNTKRPKPEAWRNVIRQQSIRRGAGREIPDYIFRIGRTPVFVVEAKKPAVSIKENQDAALQVRGYAWNSKVPAILTNFRELAVYDWQQPKVKDKATTALIGRYHYKEYAEKWEEICGVFSRSAVEDGKLDKFIKTRAGKRGGLEVDEAFLQEIQKWRKILAQNLAHRNLKLNEEELKFAVQATIDRIIFLRICEDRGLENPGRLLAQTNGSRIYPKLFKLFEDADDRYNSGLFHFREERERTSEPDRITPGLKIDDDKLKLIIQSLYENFYDFYLIPVEILGQVYERFLGNVIILKESRQVQVKEKSGEKKAKGIFYTPAWIVEYIVEQTVGKLLNDKSLAQVSKIKILDPACGSGSFLLGAYQHLLDWHLEYYTLHDPEKYKKQIYPVMGGGYRLATSEKKRILLNNIFGVDIDHQAVEVTKLSLLLKVLENETEETLRQLKLVYKQRALPDLGDNIKCGNSLVETDFEHNHQLNFLDDDERLRVNAFDWETGFPEVFGRKERGFDVVIGNPPYGSYFTPRETIYFTKHYSLFRGVKDIYVLFIQNSLNRLKEKGQLSFIVPSAWLGGPEYENLRELLLNYRIEKLILLPFDVFKDAYVDTAIMVIAKDKAAPGHQAQTYVYGKREKISKIQLPRDNYQRVKQSQWKRIADLKIVLDPRTLAVMDQIQKHTSLTFDDVLSIKRGVLFNQDLLAAKRNSNLSYKYFEGDVYRYQINFLSKHWIELNDEIKERPKESKWFEGERILLRRLVSRKQRLMATLVTDNFITNKNLYSILPKEESVGLHCILGILNSKLISYLYLNQVAQATKDDFPQITIKDILSLPFPDRFRIKAHQPRLLKLVEQMLLLPEKLSETRVDHERTTLKRQMEGIDQQIDRLVYDLYGLTDE